MGLPVCFPRSSKMLQICSKLKPSYFRARWVGTVNVESGASTEQKANA